MFNFDQYKLPVTDIIPAVKQELASGNTLIVAAPPGAGKSTLLPLAILDEPWLAGKKIIILEPRRLAASSVASRMASMLNEKVGQTVGYRIRFENKVSSQTRIEVVTEGILTRMLQSDNALEEVSLVIFDEFHERSIHADLALALCRETQQILRPDLRILVMSATLDLANLPQMLGSKVVESKGRSFAVEILYTGEQDIQSIPELCAQTIAKALKEREGDILAFLPGQAEIRKCEDILKRSGRLEDVYPLYGQLSFAEQQEAIQPHPTGGRKIVLATSIAETSITIEGIRIVVDSGFTRKSQFDFKSGLSGLKTIPISLDSADQRAGRAGRLSEGCCYRMWSKATETRMAEFRTPEILDADLSPLILNLHQWGITNFSDLTWLNTPPVSNIAGAKELLVSLGAIDNNQITNLGKRINHLPCHPRIANMLLMAEDTAELPLATDIAALLEERDPLSIVGSDLNLRIEALRRYRREGRKERRWENIEKVALAYRKLFKVDASNGIVKNYETGRLLAYAYPERIASLKNGTEGQYQLANGRTALMDKEDELSREPWIAIAHLDARKGAGKIFIAAPLQTSDVIHLSKEKENISWDTRKGGLIALKEQKIGVLVLKSSALAEVNEEMIGEVVAEAIRQEGEALLNFDEDLEAWQNRILSLKKWNGDEHWPDVSTASLLQNNKDWLWSYLSKIRKPDDLRRLNLAQILQDNLDYNLRLELDKLAPAALRVPSGSEIKLQYFPHGETPVLAVRLQEVFGLMDTPSINNGKQGVVLHLLSPGFKPVQVTSDLRSFWANAYFEVRKELKRRYPKHSWPENPLEAEAVRGVRRKA
ncbi:ATP-dependent helicase HrpB [Desertivirga arenae]|uniref:ATP-dependent helicase HrpB n=1 Tax=Desertivirga arenae TaxID=2810309 RepID=UPI001A96ABC2